MFMGMLRLSFAWLLTMGLLLAATPREAAACSCAGKGSPEDACERSSAVFAGKVVKVTRNDANYRVTATFEVTRRWKGAMQAQVDVSTANDDARCGLSFAEGEEWMIYARSEADGLSAGLCSRSRPKAVTVEDREVLGLGFPPVKVGEAPPSDGASVSTCISSRAPDAPPVKTAVQAPDAPPLQPTQGSGTPPPTARPGGCSVTAPAGGSLLVGSLLLVLRRRRR